MTAQISLSPLTRIWGSRHATLRLQPLNQEPNVSCPSDQPSTAQRHLSLTSFVSRSVTLEPAHRTNLCSAIVHIGRCRTILTANLRNGISAPSSQPQRPPLTRSRRFSWPSIVSSSSSLTKTCRGLCHFAILFAHGEPPSRSWQSTNPIWHRRTRSCPQPLRRPRMFDDLCPAMTRCSPL